MKNPKCPTCRIPTELVICYCQKEAVRQYYCWNCRKHYPIK